MVSMEFTLAMVTLVILGSLLILIQQAINEQTKTRNAQLRLEHIQFINDPDVDKALTEILWTWKWENFDEYWQKYSPRNNPEANIIRRIARNYYVALAEMVKNGDMDIELIYRLNPSGVTRYWDKIGPIAYEFRKRNNYPDYLEPVEYLASKIKEIREEKGISAPKQVK